MVGLAETIFEYENVGMSSVKSVAVACPEQPKSVNSSMEMCDIMHDRCTEGVNEY